jgi:hypothetical protein
MTEYNNYILMSDHLTRERSGLPGYSQAESLLNLCGRKHAKSRIRPTTKRTRAQWFWRRRDAA